MMRKIIITLCLIFTCSKMGICFENNYIDSIEYQKYGQSFSDESLAERLNRLENDFFGLEQTGDLDSRINNLEKISNNHIQNPTISFNDNFYPQKKNGFKNFMDNLTSTFSNTNTYTGFTPPLNYQGRYSTNRNYCPYHKKRNISRIDYGRNNSFNRKINHHRFHNHHYHPHINNFPPQNQITNWSTKSTVHILKD